MGKKKVHICGECKKARKPAIFAARLGHTDCLSAAYNELHVLNERDEYGATPIHYAARSGKLECLMWLVTKSGISPNAVSENGATAAHDAAAAGRLECLQYLLTNTHCSAKDVTKEGATVLHMACRFGRLNAVKWLMEHCGSTPSEKGANDVTPVHLCAASNQLPILQWLTRHPKYKPNERTIHGATATYFAAQEGSYKCLQWLIEHGKGDPYLTALDGMGPIHAAAQAGKTSCLEYLVSTVGMSIRIRADDGATAAHFAAAGGQVQCLEWILDHGGSAYDRDDLGGTPVHDAADQGQTVVLKTLMRRGIDLGTEDYEHLTPFDLAKEKNHQECVTLLYKATRPKRNTSSQSPQRKTDLLPKELEFEDIEKQRRFEEALLANVSAEEQEAKWEEAQKEAMSMPQPGLHQILEDGLDVFSPEYSLSKEAADVVGSLRSHRSQPRSKRAKANPYDQELGLKDEPSKPRTPLQLSLFEKPDTLPEGAHATVEANSKPGDTSPGPTMPGDTSPGSTKPGDTSPGPTMPGDTSPGPKKPGDTSPGSTKPGDTSPGPKKPGDTSPGTGVAGIFPTSPITAGDSQPGSITANHRASPGLITEGDSPLSAGHTDLLKPLEGSSTSLSALKRLWKNSWKKHSRDETSSDSASKRNKLPLKMRLKLSAYKRSASKEERPDPTLSMLESEEERSHAVEQEEDMPAYRLGGHQGSRRREGEKDNKKKKKKQMLTQGKDIHSVGQEKVEEEKMEKEEEEEVMKGSMVQTTSPVSETATFMEQHLHTVQTDQRYSTSSPSDRSGDKEATPSSPTQPKPSSKHTHHHSTRTQQDVPSDHTPEADTESPYDKMFAITSVVKVGQSETGGKAKKKSGHHHHETKNHHHERDAETPHDSTHHHEAPHDSTHHHETPHDSTHHHKAPHDSTHHHETPHDSTHHHKAPHDSTHHHEAPHDSTKHIQLQHVEKDSSSDDPTVDQGPDNLQELTNIFREVLSEGCSKEAVEPHPNVSKTVEPHPNVSKAVEPHPNVSKTVEPHPNVSKTVEPHPNVSKTVEPHPNVSKTVEPHPNVSKAVEPHPNVSKAVEPHPNVSKTVEPHPNVSKTVEPHPNVSKQNEDGDDPMQVQKPTTEPENRTERRQDSKPAIETIEQSHLSAAIVNTPLAYCSEGEDKLTRTAQNNDKTTDIPSLQGQAASLHRWGSMEGLDHIKEGSDVIGGEDDVIGGGDDGADGASVASDDTFVVRDDLAQGSQGSLTMVSERKLSSEIHRRVTQLEDSKSEGGPLTKPPAGGEVVINGNVSHMLRVFRGEDKPGEEVKQRSENALLINEGRKEAESKVLYEDTMEQSTLGPGLTHVHSLEAIAESNDEEEEGGGRRIQGAEPGDNKPQLGSVAATKSGHIAFQNEESPNALKQRKGSVISPLTTSKDASNMKGGVSMPNATPTSTSAPAPLPSLLTRRGSDGSPFYMTPANLPHLSKLLEDHQRRMVAMAQEAVDRLTKEPMSSKKVPRVFKGIRDGESNNQLYVWKQKANTLLKVTSWDSITFNSNSIFICLLIRKHGPVFHNVYIWIGKESSANGIQTSYQYCLQLTSCLFGSATINREVQGHETWPFTQLFKEKLEEARNPYHNETLQGACLFRYTNSTFTCVNPPLAYTSLESRDPLVLDTATRVYVWIPSNRTGMNGLPIAELFLTYRSYTSMVPVTVVTEGGETDEFCAHFSSWPLIDLSLAQRTERLRLEQEKRYEVAFPSSRGTAVYQLVEGRRKQVSLEQYGFFFSAGIYLISQKGEVNFLWVGKEAGSCEDAVKKALVQLADLDHQGIVPLVIVSQGKESDELLNVFKGKFIVSNFTFQQSTKRVQQTMKGVHLYEVSGSATLRIKAMEVPPAASSLDSSHSFVLTADSKVFAWSGHFSSTVERRAALVVAVSLRPMCDAIKLAEGLETPEFWSLLGGKGEHTYIRPAEWHPYSVPVLFQCSWSEGRAQFARMEVSSREDLIRDKCYLLVHKDQLLVWLGSSSWGGLFLLDILNTFISVQYSQKTLRDFVVTLVRDIHEGEMFWRVFNLLPAPEHLSGSAIYSVPLLVEEEEETGSVTRIDDYVDQGTVFKEEEERADVFKEEEERADVFKEEEERADGQVEATSEQPGVPVQVPELSQEQLAHPALSQEQLVVPIHSESPEGHLNESAAADPSVQPDSQVELAVVDGSSQQQTTESDRVTSPSDASEHKPLDTPSDHMTSHVPRISAAAEPESTNQRSPSHPPPPLQAPVDTTLVAARGGEEWVELAASSVRVVEDLGHMIDGLQNMLQRRSLSSSNILAPPTKHRRSSSLPGLRHGDEVADQVSAKDLQLTVGMSEWSLKPPSVSNLTSEESLPQPLPQPLPVKSNKSQKKPTSATITIAVHVDGSGVHQVTVKENAPVMSVIFRAAEVAGTHLTLSSALFEVAESLKIVRVLEDHLLIRDVLSSWPEKHKPILMMKEFYSKHSLWSAEPPIPKTQVHRYCHDNKIPDVPSDVLYCGNGLKLQWKKGSLSLRALGIYLSGESKKDGEMEMFASIEYCLYTPNVMQGKTLATPTPYCFVMKPAHSWKSKDMKLVCVSSYQQLAKWIHSIRLLKYGLQLKGNFIAMKTRLQKRLPPDE